MFKVVIKYTLRKKIIHDHVILLDSIKFSNNFVLKKVKQIV